MLNLTIKFNAIHIGVCDVGRACLATHRGVETLDATTVTSLSFVRIGGDLRVGSRGVAHAEIKLLHLFARPNLSAPHCQVFLLPDGKTDLCIPFVHGLYPTAMSCFALSRVYESW